MRRSAAVLAAAVILFATSCKQKPTSSAKIPITPATAADTTQHAEAMTPFKVQLDSGNVAYRAKDFTRARDHYMRATQLDSTMAAGWFGVYMAEDKLGNKAQAEYAIKRARALNPAFDEAGPHGASSDKESKT